MNGVVFHNGSAQWILKAEVLAKASESAYLGFNGKQSPNCRKIQVRWINPPFNWCKLNSDGSSFGNSGKAGGGGLIRNDKGEWLKGYARNVGHATSVAVELWALRDGIRLCIALKLLVVIIELD
nr:putative ribonuclease h protein [Quercus suber]